MNFEIVENIKEISRDFVSNLDKICSKKDFFKKIKKFIFFSKKGLTKHHPYAIIVHVDETKRRYLGVAQLVARYLGVVEAASSSLVTQTKIGGSTEPPIFFYFLAKSLEISRFRDIHNGLVLPCFEG